LFNEEINMKKIVNLATVLSALLFCSVEGMEAAPAAVREVGDRKLDIYQRLLSRVRVVVEDFANSQNREGHASINDMRPGSDKDQVVEGLGRLRDHPMLLDQAYVAGLYEEDVNTTGKPFFELCKNWPLDDSGDSMFGLAMRPRYLRGGCNWRWCSHTMIWVRLPRVAAQLPVEE
jgi:hypothetical protein